MNIQYDNLVNTTLEELHAVFHDAFSNYEIPLKLTQTQFNYLLERRGYQLDSSYGAFLDGKLIGYVINGLGKRDGLPCAYDISTGLLIIHHGKGIATKLMAFAINELKQKGIQEYSLEVIKTNAPAYALYQKSGFVINRHLDFYMFPKSVVGTISNNKNTTVRMEEIKTLDWDLFQRFWDFKPAWQNSIEAVERKADKFICLGAYDGTSLVGYGIIEPHTGDIPHLAVHPKERRKGVGSTLLQKLKERTESSNLRFINAEADCESFKGFVRNLGLEDGKGQYEMVVRM